MRTDGLPLSGYFAQWAPNSATKLPELLNRYSAKERKHQSHVAA